MGATENEIQQMLDDIRIREIQNLVRDLAGGFSARTTVIETSVGTRVYRLMRVADDHRTIEDYFITLYPFFGIHLGYNKKIDALVFWMPKEREAK